MPFNTSRKHRMNFAKMSTTEVTSYAGGIAAIGASLTLTQVGVIVGIATALLTFIMNAIYAYRKDKREQTAADLTRREMETRIALLEQKDVPKP